MVPVVDWVQRCPDCGLEASSLESGAATVVGGGLEPLRRKNFETIWSNLEGLGDVRGTRVLEVGCERGWFLEAAQKRGAQATGIEPGECGPSTQARGFDVLLGLFPDVTSGLADGSFDFVAFNDVFEHFPDPISALKECDRLLNKNGRIVINLPVNTGVIYRLAKVLSRVGGRLPFERLWQKGYASPHLFYFSPKALDTMISNNSNFHRLSMHRLSSMSLTGLWSRIRESYGNVIIGSAIYMGCVMLTVFEIIFPADIEVFIFERVKP